MMRSILIPTRTPLGVRYDVDIAPLLEGLSHLGIGDAHEVAFAPFGDRIRVTVDGEYYGVWDTARKTFVD